MPKLPNELLKQIRKVTNKRARFVLDTIARKGLVTTEEINRAGYDHPPRAARDVRELGFPLTTVKVKHSNGRTIAAYTLPTEGIIDPAKIGRQTLPKKLRNKFVQALGNKCQICGVDHNLQLDHRVPYQVSAESSTGDAASYQLLCGSCNRKKSWTCEHCENWLRNKESTVCRSCYWAGHSDYTHVALKQQRRIDLVGTKERSEIFSELRKKQNVGTSVSSNALNAFSKITRATQADP